MPPFEERRSEFQGYSQLVGEVRDGMREMRTDIREIRADARAVRTAFDLHKDDVIERLTRLEEGQTQNKRGTDVKVTGFVAVFAAAVGGVFTAACERLLK